MGFFKNRIRNDVRNQYQQSAQGPTRYRDRDSEVLSPDMVFTWMEAADERPEAFSMDLIMRSLEAASANGNIVRARTIKRDLRWLAKQAEKAGIPWEQVP